MGAVYEAIDERLGIRVALKESFASDGELRNQFEREALLLASLRHPALPRVTDYFIEGEHGFLVMEYVPGPTLASVLSFHEGKPFDSAQVVKWADQALDVLVYLHGQDRVVIHRDIKPQNIKLTEAGGICLIDFGLAKVQSDEGRSIHGFTRRYAPIEQIEDRGTTERSDIYALGATLYHLLTGVKPADAEVRASVTGAGGADPLVAGHVLCPAIGFELSSILSRALAQRSEDRFASASEFRDALRKVGRIDSEVANEPIKGIQGAKGSRVGWLAAAACLLVVVTLALLSVFIWKWRGDVSPSGDVAAVIAKDSTEAKKPEGTETVWPQAGDKRRRVLTRAKPAIVAIVTAKVPTKVQNLRAAHARVEVAKLVDKNPPRKLVSLVSSRPASVKSDEVLRAPDGTEVVKYRDGRVRTYQAGERRQ